MRRRFSPVAAAALGMACLALAAPAAAVAAGPGEPADLTCQITGTTLAYSGTYDDVTVPPGQTCELSGATILGNVTVQSAGSVTFESPGTVVGSLLLGRLATASEGSGWVIAGPAAADGAASLTISGTVHGIFATGTDILALQSATVDGSVVSNRGVFGGAITSSVITGNVIVNDTTGAPGLAGDWFIAGPQLNGSPQQIEGNVILSGNQVPIYLFENHITRDLVCEGNNPPPLDSFAGLANTVDGRSIRQCATAHPASAGAVGAARARAAAGWWPSP